MLERRAPMFGRVFWKGSADDRSVALTFDDGPTEPYTSRILDILRDKGVKATFFVLGRRAESLPAIVDREVAEGHEVGNHGYDHSVLPLRGPSFTRDQIERTSAIVERAGGRRPTLFRASHGWRNPWVNREAAAAGCETVGWTLGVWDTDRPGADVIRERTRRGVEPGCILLLHDGRGLEPGADASQVVEALPQIIDDLRADGYRFATVSEMMRVRTR
jgi:peptidoglycan/xylan/chitin deacetylase (PgdA/CDA1 family)